MLLIDCGNTAVKCRWIQQVQVCDQLFPLHQDLKISSFAEYLNSISVHDIFLANVSNEEVCKKIIMLIQQAQPQAKFTQLFSLPQLNGIKNGYIDYTRLGVDRWLTLIAASELVDTDVAIIDAGSAITIDLLSRQKGHLGGAILPGFHTDENRFRSLFPAVDFSHPDIKKIETPGRSTESCINLSEIPVTVQQIQNILSDWMNLLEKPCSILLSGQDAGLMSERLPSSHRVVPDLVFIGMLKQIRLLGGQIPEIMHS